MPVLITLFSGGQRATNRKKVNLSTFAPLQYKSTHTTPSVRQSVTILRPLRVVEPSNGATVAEPVVSPDRQNAIGFSLSRIPIDLPVQAPESIFMEQQKNNTGLPDQLKAGIESLSDMSLDDVKVHYHSPNPAKMQAWAYTKGADIYVGPGQERNLPHEAWHVVQQKEGRVKPTLQAMGAAINDDQALEKEADMMGAMALDGKKIPKTRPGPNLMWTSEMAKTEPAYQQSWHMSVGVSPVVVQRNGKKLVETRGKEYKKKAKERKEEAKVQKKLDDQINDWISNYGHSQARHVGKTDQELDARNIPLATTFESNEELFKAAKELITDNEQKLNDWYENKEDERITLWASLSKEIRVRGRRKKERPAWHFKLGLMPPHPGFENVNQENLEYVIGVFDRNSWTNAPKGLVTCYPSVSKPK